MRQACAGGGDVAGSQVVGQAGETAAEGGQAPTHVRALVIAFGDGAQPAAAGGDHGECSGRIATVQGPLGGDQSADGVIGIVLGAQGFGRRAGRAGGGVEGADIGGQARENSGRRLGAVELLGDQAVDEGLQRPAVGGLVDLEPRLGAAEVGDGLGIVDAVAAMAAEDRGGDVGGAGGARDAREQKVGIGAAVAVAGLAGDPGPRRLAAQGQGIAEGGPADLDPPGRVRIGGGLQAFRRLEAQGRDDIMARRQPGQGLQARRRRGGGRYQEGQTAQRQARPGSQPGSPPAAIQRSRVSTSAQP